MTKTVPFYLFFDPRYNTLNLRSFRRQRHKLSAPTVLYINQSYHCTDCFDIDTNIIQIQFFLKIHVSPIEYITCNFNKCKFFTHYIFLVHVYEYIIHCYLLNTYFCMCNTYLRHIDIFIEHMVYF
jgi:hypothetical protein